LIRKPAALRPQKVGVDADPPSERLYLRFAHNAAST
jgi:hypothetical protein